MLHSQREDGKHQKYVFLMSYSAAWGRTHWSCLLCSCFLIKHAGLSVGWRMCSIQWDGYRGHDEWAVISNCCRISVSLTPGYSLCCQSVQRLHMDRVKGRTSMLMQSRAQSQGVGIETKLYIWQSSLCSMPVHMMFHTNNFIYSQFELHHAGLVVCLGPSQNLMLLLLWNKETFIMQQPCFKTQV